MRGVVVLALILALASFAAQAANADSYYIYDDWGGTWADAEKTSGNTDDDLLCWAASSSNILEWTGWGLAGGMTNTDQMFGHFQDHFSDAGGNPYYGWDWWFDGTNDGPGTSNWAQEDVDGGGGFWSSYNINDYRHFSSSDSAAMSTIDDWLHAGYGTTISIGGAGAHSITVWGYTTDTSGAYTGLYVTDSDDDKNGNGTRPNVLQHYDVEYTSSRWYLQDYYSSNAWYITEVVSLGQAPAPVPEPASLLLLALGLGGLGVRSVRRRRRSA